MICSRVIADGAMAARPRGYCTLRVGHKKAGIIGRVIINLLAKETAWRTTTNTATHGWDGR
jgi:hypothetical protein